MTSSKQRAAFNAQMLVGRGDANATLNGASVPVAYDAVGNITSKDGVTYAYAASGAGSVRPKAVTERSIGGTSIATYAYDASGNTTSGDGRTLTWTSFDMPRTIAQGATTFVFRANPAGAGTYKWTVSLPLQPKSHDNAVHNKLHIYTRRPD